MIDNQTILDRLDAMDLLNQQQAAKIEHQANCIRELSDDNARIRQMLDRLMPTSKAHKTFPGLHDIDKLEVEIFHNEDIDVEKKRGGASEWMARVEYWHDGRKQEAIKFSLLARKPLLAKLHKYDAPDSIIDVASHLHEELGGISRFRPVEGGRPYNPNLLAVLAGYETGCADDIVLVLDDGQTIEISGFEEARGFAMWRAQWERASFCDSRVITLTAS